jgi:hypothetical protein
VSPRDIGKLLHVLADKVQKLIQEVREISKRVTALEKGAKK